MGSCTTDSLLTDDAIVTRISLLARDQSLEMARNEIADLVCRVKDKPKVLPGLCLRMIQKKVRPDLLEQVLAALSPEYAGLRSAILGAAHCHDLPYLSEQDLHHAAARFSDAAASAGLVPLDRNAASWIARLFDQKATRAEIPKDQIIVRRLERGPDSAVETLFLCAGDPRYFFAFSEFYLHSLMEFAGPSAGVHFVLLDFSEGQLQRARAIFSKYTGRVSISFSTMQLKPGISNSFYCIARFYELIAIWPLLSRTKTRNLVITDIDHVFIHAVNALPVADKSLAIGYVTANYLFPWLRFRANLMLVNLVCDQRPDVDMAISVIGQSLALISASKEFWYLDQACIAFLLQRVAHLSGRPSTVRDISKPYLAISFQPTGDRFDTEAKFRRLIALRTI
jgi:hypothetical protein